MHIDLSVWIVIAEAELKLLFYCSETTSWRNSNRRIRGQCFPVCTTHKTHAFLQGSEAQIV